MSHTFLYQNIAEAIRRDIREQTLHPGDRLPSVRELAEQWNCTIGTVQRAYETLAAEGLIISRPGQGTHVADVSPVAEAEPLRRANLVHRAEAFLLEALTAGHNQLEIEQAFRLALDRWRGLNQSPPSRPEHTLRFVGSHDSAVALLPAQLGHSTPDIRLQLTFTGSLGGLIALAEGEADLAGIHLWDEESGIYNAPFVQRLLPGRRVALLTLAQRRLGLAIGLPHPANVSQLADLTQPDVQFINRQRGAGTRVWLDACLHRLGLLPEQINGYNAEAITHTEVARHIAERQANVGLAIESVALAYGLEFVPLTTEQYDLAIPAEIWDFAPIQQLAAWLLTEPARQQIAGLGGYDVTHTGQVAWVN